MFRRLRLQLTLWYVGILALIVGAVVVLVYFLVAHSLDEEINDSLQDVNQQAATILRSAAQEPPSGQAGSGLSEPIARDGEEGDGNEEDERGEESSHSRDDEFAAVAADQPLGATGDVFLLILDTAGHVVANPRGIPLDDLSYQGSLAGALEQGDVRKDVTVDDSRLRLLTVAVASDGEAAGFVVTGKSLEQRDHELRLLLVLLGLGGGVGVVLAGLGGLWVAGLAMRPVRRAFERQREFVADASHELRTPLAVVRANAESLLNKTSGAHREAIEDIVDETGQMGRLVADMLTLALTDRGQLELHCQPLDLFDVVSGVDRAGRHLAMEKGLDITSSADHIGVDGDPDRLRQVFLILIDNAVRHTPSGGRIAIQARRFGRNAEITVEDTGAGVEPEELGRIFERFYRVDRARARAEGRLGLGLSIARAIVDAHGGTIEAQSVPGRGTTVRIVLPIAPLQAKTASSSRELGSAGPAHSGLPSEDAS